MKKTKKSESLILSLPESFQHTAPEGYSYEVEEFKRNIISIWIRNHYKFIYNDGASARSIWGFFNTKTESYHAPINSSKCGDSVEFGDTTPYSAMQLKLSILEQCFH
jgi:hypothetical protein